MTRAAWVFALVLPLTAGAIDPGSLPEDQRENYEAFRVRCSKCHALEKPLNVHLSADNWRRYVGKMKRRPGSGISEQVGDKIIAFLVFKDAPLPEPDAGNR